MLHHRSEIPHDTIVRCDAMMQKVMSFLPTEEGHLADTPYAKQENYHNLADERWEGLANCFHKAAQIPFSMAVVI